MVDKASYTRIEQLLMQLQDGDLIRTRPVIIVANKIDLARSRAVSSQGTSGPQNAILNVLEKDNVFSLFDFSFCADGKCLACTYRAKFIEVSVGINHNVDELLAGTLTQIRLKKEQNALQVS